jgi:hypothetical protein
MTYRLYAVVDLAVSPAGLSTRYTVLFPRVVDGARLQSI